MRGCNCEAFARIGDRVSSAVLAAYSSSVVLATACESTNFSLRGTSWVTLKFYDMTISDQRTFLGTTAELASKAEGTKTKRSRQTLRSSGARLHRIDLLPVDPQGTIAQSCSSRHVNSQRLISRFWCFNLFQILAG
jgi:hypothetical protein